MTSIEQLAAGVIIAFVGYCFDAWSERHNDPFVRRFSMFHWVAVAAVAILASFAMYHTTRNVAATLTVMGCLVIAGGNAGWKLARLLKDQRTKRVQRRARQEVR